MIRIVSVVGARPNFMKIAPFVEAVLAHNNSLINDRCAIEHRLVHTGQHYDERMSKSFFGELNIPMPDVDLEIGSGTHAEQVGRTMIAFEKTLENWRPDWVVVVGDVNATCACSIAAKKLNIKVAHIESGLRSCDMEMPEEINRLVTDRISDLLFTTDRIASENLLGEGVDSSRIAFVGNIMIDTLEKNRARAEALSVKDIVANNLLDVSRVSNLVNESFDSNAQLAVVTMHRPSNVDKEDIMRAFLQFLSQSVARDLTVIWPIHPRTAKRLEEFGLLDEIVRHSGIFLIHPVGYLEMLRLNMATRVMFTDSGGLQEECCVLGTPCLTLRWNTERPVTLREHGGACVLVGNDSVLIQKEYHKVLREDVQPLRPENWDGCTAPRIVQRLVEDFGRAW